MMKFVSSSRCSCGWNFSLNLNKIKGLFIVPEDEEIVNKKTSEKKKETKKSEIKTPETKLSNKTKLSSTSSPAKGEFNKQIFDSLTKRGIPCILKIYDEEGHGFRKLENIEDYYKTVFDFLNSHL